MFLDPRRPLPQSPRFTLAAPAGHAARAAYAAPGTHGQSRPRTSALTHYIRYAPLLWCLGLLQVAAALMLAVSAVRRWPREGAVNAVVLLWLSIWILQATSALFNGFMLGDTLLGVRNAFSFTSIGWMFAGLALAMGAAAGRPASSYAPQFAVLSLYTLLLGGATLLAIQLGLTVTQFATPIGLLFGDEGMSRFAAINHFAVREQTFGEPVWRLILMYPWPTATGIGSLGLMLISTRASGHWRWIGIAGGILGVIFSWSRLAILSAIFVLYLLALLRTSGWLRVALLMLGGLICAATFISPEQSSLVGQAWEVVANARAGSSIARELIYAESWRGFLESPLLGHGWVGESVHPTEPLPIGSHSSVLGTLYTGGLAVFSAFVLSLLATLGLVGHRLASARSEDIRADREIALCLVTVLVVASFHEALYSLVLPCFFYFVWIGAAISGRSEDAPVIERTSARTPTSIRPRAAFNRYTPHVGTSN